MEERAKYKAGGLSGGEHEIQRRLCDVLMIHHALVIRVNSGRSGSVSYNRWGVYGEWRTGGAPDLIAVLPEGEVWFIEVKARGGRLSPSQEAFRDALRMRGGRWMTSDEAMRELTQGAFDE